MPRARRTTHSHAHVERTPLQLLPITLVESPVREDRVEVVLVRKPALKQPFEELVPNMAGTSLLWHHPNMAGTSKLGAASLAWRIPNMAGTSKLGAASVSATTSDVRFQR